MRVAVLSAHGWPEPELNTAVTLDLGDDPFPMPGIRYEFYIVSKLGWDIDQVLGDVGVRVRREIVAPEPREFIEHGLRPTYEDLKVQHLAVLDPPTVTLPVTPPGVDPPAGFLQLVPFTDAELEVLGGRGRPGFYRLLRDQGRRLLDFARE
jgi:hypothetical protein